MPPGTSRVGVALVPDGDGTIVRVTHRDLPAETRKPHAEGWQHYLARVATVASGGDPGPDPWATDSESDGIKEETVSKPVAHFEIHVKTAITRRNWQGPVPPGRRPAVDRLPTAMDRRPWRTRRSYRVPGPTGRRPA